ncbi:MAG: MFS transporter [archaeon]
MQKKLNKISEEENKKNNIKLVLVGYFFIALTGVLLSFFLPFYLKQEGLSILEIGALFTVGLGVGNFIVSVFFSKFLRKIKLKTGLNITVLFGFFQSFFFFIFPNAIGVFLSQMTNHVKKSTSKVSSDVALQHNVPKKEHRKVFSHYLISDSLGLVIGIILSLLLITWIGFRISFLIFAILALPAFLFYNKVSDNTRFKLKDKVKLPKTSGKLKLLMLSEVVYWLALASSFALVITFLVEDLFFESMFWIGYLFIGLYGSIIITTLVANKFLGRLDLVKTSIFGMLILFISAVLVIIAIMVSNIYMVLIGFILEGVGAGIWVPSKGAIYWQLTNKNSREKVAGYLHGWNSIVKSVGPLAGGYLVFQLGILAPFYFKAILSCIVMLVYIYILKSN